MEDVSEVEKESRGDISKYLMVRLKQLESTCNKLREEKRKLESERRYVESERVRLDREIRKLRNELERLKSVPLVVASVVEVLDDGRAIVKSSTGPNFVVNVSQFVKEEELIPGARIALNQQSFAVVDVLPSSKDPLVCAMEIEERPTVTYRDIGGLKGQIEEIRETVELPLKKPELFEKVGIEPPNGVMLFGAPGTGKTLLAKAVSNKTEATFIKIVGSEFVQKYIGEGARLVRELFQMAKEKAPSIIFVDELDAIAARRLETATSGDREVQRTLMQLLSEMDGFDPRENVRIIGATNRPDILDPAILRPGRFDRLIKVPMPNEDARVEIFKIHTRKMNLADEVDLKELAIMTDHATGADIKAICTEAGMFAIRENQEEVSQDNFIKASNKVMGEEELFHQRSAVMYV